MTAQNPIFLKHAAMSVSESFDILAHDTDGNTQRRINGRLWFGPFELTASEIGYVSDNVSKALSVWLTASGYERVTFVCMWKKEAAHAVVQVHGINSEGSTVLFAGRV